MKKTITDNYRVVVEPDYRWGKPTEADCNSIKEQINRHVDDIGNVYVEWDTTYICEFCGYGWEVQEEENDPDNPVGIPLCCGQAQTEWENNNK